MFNRVISFGDSFVYGSELKDCFEHDLDVVQKNPEKYPHEFQLSKERELGIFSEAKVDGSRSEKIIYSLNTWPALIAKNLDVKYYCRAWPGISNQTIVRKIIKFSAEFESTDLVIIDWTFCDRWDYIDVNVKAIDRLWKTLTPASTNDTEVTKFYFKYIQSELWNKWESLRAMLLTYHTLKSQNVSFLMTCEDKLIFDNEYHRPKYIKNAQDTLSTHINWFDDKGFYYWAKDNNFPTGSANDHPLEEAHKKAAEYVLNNLL